MAILRDIKTYILEDQFKLTYQNNTVDIVNYTEINHFDSNKIMISFKDGSICVKGKELVVSKLLASELLIEGSIEMIEFR